MEIIRLKMNSTPNILNSQIEYSHDWFYHKKCDAYLVYLAGGNFVCDKCGYPVLFTDLGLTTENLKQYYPDWNKPNGSNYDDDKGSIEFFENYEKENKIKISNSKQSEKELIIHTCRICKKSDICKGKECEFIELLQIHEKCKIKEEKTKEQFFKKISLF